MPRDSLGSGDLARHKDRTIFGNLDCRVALPTGGFEEFRRQGFFQRCCIEVADIQPADHRDRQRAIVGDAIVTVELGIDAEFQGQAHGSPKLLQRRMCSFVRCRRLNLLQRINLTLRLRLSLSQWSGNEDTPG